MIDRVFIVEGVFTKDSPHFGRNRRRKGCEGIQCQAKWAFGISLKPAKPTEGV